MAHPCDWDTPIGKAVLDAHFTEVIQSVAEAALNSGYDDTDVCEKLDELNGNLRELTRAIRAFHTNSQDMIYKNLRDQSEEAENFCKKRKMNDDDNGGDDDNKRPMPTYLI